MRQAWYTEVDMKHRSFPLLTTWAPMVAVITILCGLVYVSVQQVLRQGANDPQIQMVEDMTMALERGDTAEATIAAMKPVDIGMSLAPFMTIYDAQGVPLFSSGKLNGKLPTLPAGVFKYVRTHGEDRVTWQPEPGVRVAAVVKRVRTFQSGFVLAGRSLREVEKREDRLHDQIILAWSALLVVSLAWSLWLTWPHKK